MPQDTTMVLAPGGNPNPGGADGSSTTQADSGIAPKVRCTPRAAAARRAAPEQLRIAACAANPSQMGAGFFNHFSRPSAEIGPRHKGCCT